MQGFQAHSLTLCAECQLTNDLFSGSLIDWMSDTRSQDTLTCRACTVAAKLAIILGRSG